MRGGTENSSFYDLIELSILEKFIKLVIGQAGYVYDPSTQYVIICNAKT